MVTKGRSNNISHITILSSYQNRKSDNDHIWAFFETQAADKSAAAGWVEHFTKKMKIIYICRWNFSIMHFCTCRHYLRTCFFYNMRTQEKKKWVSRWALLSSYFFERRRLVDQHQKHSRCDSYFVSRYLFRRQSTYLELCLSRVLHPHISI